MAGLQHADRFRAATCWANTSRASGFELQRELGKIGKPVVAASGT